VRRQITGGANCHADSLSVPPMWSNELAARKGHLRVIARSAWGLQAYLTLIGCAADRQTVTYDALARRIKCGGPNLLAKPLALITRWCQHHSLPALASLVVEQATGLPALGFAAVGRDEIPREQERVWAFDWYAIFPPTIEELVEN
jgi:hypothetical protein